MELFPKRSCMLNLREQEHDGFHITVKPINDFTFLSSVVTTEATLFVE
jgi:hypothetical protein